MPIYAYKCQTCGVVYDRLVNSKEDIPSKCPDAKCQGKLERSMADERISIGGHSGERKNEWSKCPINNLTKLIGILVKIERVE